MCDRSNGFCDSCVLVPWLAVLFLMRCRFFVLLLLESWLSRAALLGLAAKVEATDIC
jgi:hypothetical protein